MLRRCFNMEFRVISVLLLLGSWQAQSRGLSRIKPVLVTNTSQTLGVGINTFDVNAPARATNFTAILRAAGRSRAFSSALQTTINSHAKQPKDGHYGAYKARVPACKECITFYPKIEQGGSDDGHYRKWPAQCYVGDCEFEDPWAAGPPDTSCGDAGWECWYWGLQDMCKNEHYGLSMRTLCKATCGTCTGQKYCFSRDPIAKYDDCQQVLYADATQVMDLSRVCEYNHQIMVMSNPQVWYGNIKPFTMYRDMATSELDCMKIIQDGRIVYDDDDSFDSRRKPGQAELPLGTCCERVHKYFTCMGNPEKEKLMSQDTEGLDFLDQASYNILGAFQSYCTPLFMYPTKEEFCAKYPRSDPCVKYTACEPCTEHKGVWCPETKTCMSQRAHPEKCTNREHPTQCLSYINRMKRLRFGKIQPTTTTTTTTSIKITPVHRWWYEIMGMGNYFAKNYIPSPYIKVKQGKPGNYMPEEKF